MTKIKQGDLVALWISKKELDVMKNALADYTTAAREGYTTRSFVPLMVETKQMGKGISKLFKDKVVKVDLNRVMDDSADINPTVITKEDGKLVVKHRK